MRKILIIFIAFVLSAGAASCAKNIPPPEQYNPEKAFEEANKQFDKKNYEEARRKFEDIRSRDSSEYAPLASLRIADAYAADDDPELAVDEYRRFLDEYPRHKYASYAQNQIGQVYYQMISGPDRGFSAAVRALDEFQKLMSLYPRNPYREQVVLKIQRCREIIADHEFMVGNFYFKKGAYNGVIGRLEGLMRDFPEYRDMDEVIYRLAVSYKGLGKDGPAKSYLDLLGEKYPGDGLIGKTEKKFREMEKKRKDSPVEEPAGQPGEK